jgi:hypothetical protein
MNIQRHALPFQSMVVATAAEQCQEWILHSNCNPIDILILNRKKLWGRRRQFNIYPRENMRHSSIKKCISHDKNICQCWLLYYSLSGEDSKSHSKCNSYVVVGAKNSFASCVAAKFSRQSEQVNEESGAHVVSY